MSNVNIGATQAHRILYHLKGGYEMVGGTKVEFKNFQRDHNCFMRTPMQVCLLGE